MNAHMNATCFLGTIKDSSSILLYQFQEYLLFMQVKRMEMEARSLSPNLSSQCLGKVRDYKADLQKLSQEVTPSSNKSSQICISMTKVN